MYNTPICELKTTANNNRFFMKRDDLHPFSFGGNKARKAEYFFKDIAEKKSDIVITYGSSSSNHCRVIANHAASLNMECLIISPIENYEKTYNSELISLFGAQIIKVPVNEVSGKIRDVVGSLCARNRKPYFIQGGGHGNLGTQAYVDAFKEIHRYESCSDLKFDYIFHASGTGTTQAGLVCGQILNSDFEKKIIGISIARSAERGRGVVADSVCSYLNRELDELEKYIYFVDDYICGGYGKYSSDIISAIKSVLINDGVALNATYTGKAYCGMLEYIQKNNIRNKNILFINTGGTPLFFDNMGELVK